MDWLSTALNWSSSELSSILLHIIFFAVVVVIIDGGFLVLQVLRDQVIHIAFRLGKLHLVHALTSVPVEESLAPEHCSELLGDSLEKLLDGSGVTNKCGRHFEASGGDVTHSSLDVVWDPFHKVGAVLVLDAQHLLVHLLHGHSATEDSRHSQIAPMPRITG